MRFESFSDCLAYLASFTDYEKMARTQYGQSTYNLDRMRRLLGAVGNPHLATPTVHVAGTKGKGSTAIILHQLLRAHGRSSGLYTSPHLVSLLERIRVDGADVSEGEFVGAMNTLRPYLVELYKEAELTRPTFFEIVTAAAFLIFKARNVDWAIIEVGVGGRLDATNVVLPVACAITLIDYDHMDKLGDTLAKIAYEKAGIIKPRVPVVTAESGSEAFPVIKQAANDCAAPLYVLGQDFRLREQQGGAFSVTTWRAKYDRLRLPVLGRHQRVNAAMALALLDCLAERGLISPTPEAVRAGLASVRLPGRIETFRPSGKSPLIVIDGAHNPISMRALAETLREIQKGTACGPVRVSFAGNVAPRFAGRKLQTEKPRETGRYIKPKPAATYKQDVHPPTAGYAKENIVLVLGMSEDKQIEPTFREILDVPGSIVFTAAANPRAAKPELLLKTVRDMGFSGNVSCAGSVAAALYAACAAVGRTGLVVVSGSFYVAGEALSVLRNDE